VGQASAFMGGTILEAREDTTPSIDIGEEGMFLTLSDAGKSAAYEEMTFQESTSVDGIIRLFDKDMSWESGIRRIRD